MAMTITSFEKFCESYGNVLDNTRIVLGENETIVQGDADAGLMGRKIAKGGVSQAEENNRVRTELMSALKNEFGTKLPDSVKKALIGSSFVGGSDMSTGADGNVNSGRPLTMRRIKAVVAAAREEMEIAAQARRFMSGELTKADIDQLNADPTGTETPVTVKYPEDLESIKKAFSEKNRLATSDAPKLDGFKRYFERNYTYILDGKHLHMVETEGSPLDDKTKRIRDKADDDMMDEMRAFFGEQNNKLLNVLDLVFFSQLSIQMSDHLYLTDNVSVTPDFYGCRDVKLELAFSKNSDGSFHVDFFNGARNFNSFTYRGAGGNSMGVKMRKQDAEGGTNFVEYHFSFDVKMVNGEPVVTSDDIPTQKFQMSANSFAIVQ